MFSYVSPEPRIPKDHPLRAIRALVDEVLADMSREFDRLYATTGRPSIPPERLLRAQLLQVFYSIRSELLLMEQLDYNLLFRWFVGLTMDDPVWDATTFTKNRDRLLNQEIARSFFRRAVGPSTSISDESSDDAAYSRVHLDAFFNELLENWCGVDVSSGAIRCNGWPVTNQSRRLHRLLQSTESRARDVRAEGRCPRSPTTQDQIQGPVDATFDALQARYLISSARRKHDRARDARTRRRTSGAATASSFDAASRRRNDRSVTDASRPWRGLIPSFGRAAGDCPTRGLRGARGRPDAIRRRRARFRA
jgi:transposase